MIPSDGAQKIKEKKETSNLINQARARQVTPGLVQSL